MEVDELFVSKIRCLEKYVSVSRHLLHELESGMFDHLENVYHERESILKAIDLYDSRITQTLQALPADKITGERLNHIQELMSQWKSLCQEAYDLDAKMIQRIESERDAVQAEITQTQKSKEVIGRFHSQSGRSAGESLDQKG